MIVKLKVIQSTEYNFIFNPVNGFFARWGKTKDDDPSYSPFGPEILDIEVSTICGGINSKPCTHCYKSNTSKGKNMSLDTFKTILSKMPKTLTQIAFGIGDIDSNPDLFAMFEHSRLNGVVPNVTINGWNLTDEYADKLASLCGAVAVSRYNPNDTCYNAVKKLIDRGMKQVNIHMMVSRETLDSCHKALEDCKNDPRLSGMNAIVFLLMKPKGKRNKMNCVNLDEYKKLVDAVLASGVRIGFDSCSAPYFLKSVEGSTDFEKYDLTCESCESSIFSGYINVDGRYFHCSFTEGEEGWEGIDVVNCNDFVKGVWNADETLRFRKSLTEQNHSLSKTMRVCPIYPTITRGI